MWFVGRRVAVQLIVGLATGVACTMVWDSLFSSGRAGVMATHLESLLGVTAILIAIAVIA